MVKHTNAIKSSSTSTSVKNLLLFQKLEKEICLPTRFNFLNDIVHYVKVKLQFRKHKRRHTILCEYQRNKSRYFFLSTTVTFQYIMICLKRNP